MRRPDRRGFTLVEVLAAFAIALAIITPIAMTIGGVAGTLGALDRSADRRLELQEAAIAAALATPLREGIVALDQYEIVIERYPIERSRDLEMAGWQLYALRVHHGSRVVLETLRMGRP